MKKSVKRSLDAYIRQMDRIDLRVIACVILLNVFGLIMIYSASAYSCSTLAKYNYDSLYLLKKQGIFVLAGIVVMLLLQYFNYNYLQKLAPIIFLVSVGSLFLLRTGLAVRSHGAARWIRLGPVQLQVAELVKIAMVIMIAAFVAKHANQVQRFKNMAVYLWIFFTIIPAGMVMFISNNLSSALIILGIGFMLSFVFTNQEKLHGIIAGIGLIGIFVGRKLLAKNLPTQKQLNASSSSFRMGRFYAWIDPERYAGDQGFQPLQGKYAVASGGLFGKGLGNSVQKLDKIPEAQNDMIFSIVCEELGLVGAVVLLAMFLFLIYHLIRIAVNSENLFGKVLVMGIAFHISLQVLINVGVVLTIIPNTGASLPFISYGGSAVLFTLAEMGIVLSVNRYHMRRSLQRKSAELEKEEEQ